jgi:hypothetical protein
MQIGGVELHLNYDLTLGSRFVGSAKADLLGSDFTWLESEFAAVSCPRCSGVG